MNLRPTWSQVLLMFVCSIPAATILMLAALLVLVSVETRGPGVDHAWRLLAHLLSPGFYVANVYETHTTHKGMDLTPWGIIIGTDFVFYFCLVFWLAIRLDRRWRQRRAERIIPDETP